MRDHLRRGAAAGAASALVFAIVELVLSLATTRSALSFPAVARFAALDLSLAAVLALLVAPIFALIWAGVRSVVPPSAAGASRAVPWGWAGILVVAGYSAASVALTLTFMARFKAKVLIALSLAGAQLGLIALGALVVYILGTLLGDLARKLEPRLGRANPLSRWLPALILLVLLAAGPLVLVFRRVHALADVVPAREILAVLVVAIAATALAQSRFRLVPATRRGWLALLVPLVALVVLTLGNLGADPGAKSIALSGSPPLTRLMALVRTVNDVDRDGYGSLLGENDCAPFDARINPNARDLPDNGVDENCNGQDFTAGAPPSWRRGPHLPVPPAFQKKWNILLVTIDTVRYDHTGFGGYKLRRGRDTTPRLDAFVQEAVSFAFAQAPSAGTMASIPAILTSRFFHSGISLGPDRKGQPPVVLPENVTLPEILKDHGYATAAITTHDYFEDWGLDQGVDAYDNSLGMPPEPRRSPAPQATDKAIETITRMAAGEKPWFLWVHYIDPHGRYVAHPGGVSFGTTEEDLYDGELAFTDEHLGRLLAWLEQSPEGDSTVVVITSDHGDGFNEHGTINHGFSLYFELLHVPLIIRVPGVAPRVVPGVVSNLDVLPTLAELTAAPIGDLLLEGESLAPQLFHDRDARDRVVFAETNAPEPIRAAITSTHKLVYSIKSNHYQLFDLVADPTEQRNLWGKDIAASSRMKALLDEWLDRVYYSRDPGSQAEQRRRQKFMLAERPTPRRPLEGQFAGQIRVLGFDVGTPVAGKDLDVTCYFEALTDGTTVYRAELALLGDDDKIIVRQEKAFGDGVFPTSRWQRGDLVKETFRLKLPAGHTGGTLRLSLLDPDRRPIGSLRDRLYP